MNKHIPSPIPFINFDLNYSPLPPNYPVHQLSPLEFQPAAYTQGDKNHIYVTIVLPLPGQLFIELPNGIGYRRDGVKHVFTCEIQLMNDLDSQPTGRLGIMGFSIDIAEGMSCESQWEILVSEIEGGENDTSLGKVVMDANILPTLEDKKA
jgi:hypothetical protein